ncbi:MAG: CapA family protein, partial [Armatimonadetes bacterium]|nr:CapA family protein [Armatimonadota bacterium]
DRNGILYCGGRREKSTSWWPVYLTAGGLKIGFMAYTDLSFNHGSDNKVDADLSNLRRQVSAADGKCDLLVVSFHWGEEYQRMPTERQRRVARAAIDSGADLVLGHHPHVLEGVTAYGGAPIIYSMGNFVFDQAPGERMESAIFELRYTEGQGWELTATPVVISRTRFGPEYPSPDDACRIARRIVNMSALLGSYPELLPDNRVRMIVKRCIVVSTGHSNRRSW